MPSGQMLWTHFLSWHLPPFRHSEFVCQVHRRLASTLVKGDGLFPSLHMCPSSILGPVEPELWEAASALRPLSVDFSISARWYVDLQSGLMSTPPLLWGPLHSFPKSSGFSKNRCHKCKIPSRLPSNRRMKEKLSPLFLKGTWTKSQTMQGLLSNSLSPHGLCFLEQTITTELCHWMKNPSTFFLPDFK